MENSTAPGTDPNAARMATRDGMSEPQAKESAADEARRQAMQRAEELVDRWGEQVGQYVSALGHNILKWAARAREEAEDIWAEAQALRQRSQTANAQSQSAPPKSG